MGKNYTENSLLIAADIMAKEVGFTGKKPEFGYVFNPEDCSHQLIFNTNRLIIKDRDVVSLDVPLLTLVFNWMEELAIFNGHKTVIWG